MQTPIDPADMPTEPGEDVDALARLQARRHQLTLEALKEVSAGLLVDHEVIEKWVESLE